MVGVWWGEGSSSPGAISSHTTQLLCSCLSSARAEKYSGCWWCWCLSPLQGISHLMPCGHAVHGYQGLGKHLCCESTRREMAEGAAEELPSRCSGLLCQQGSQLRSVQAAGDVVMVTSARDRGLVPFPAAGLSSPQHRRNSSGEGWAASDPAVLSHGGLSLLSHFTSWLPAWLGLWVRAEPCRTLLQCWAQGLENEENKLKRRAKLMFLLASERPCTQRVWQAHTEYEDDCNSSAVCFVCLHCKLFGPRTVPHHVFTQIQHSRSLVSVGASNLKW